LERDGLCLQNLSPAEHPLDVAYPLFFDSFCATSII